MDQLLLILEQHENDSTFPVNQGMNLGVRSSATLSNAFIISALRAVTMLVDFAACGVDGPELTAAL